MRDVFADWIVAISIFLPSVAIATCVRFRRAKQGTTTANTCRDCEYSMIGLGAAARCPECGCTDPRIHPKPERVVVRLLMQPQLGVAIVALPIGVTMLLHWTVWSVAHEVTGCCRINFKSLDGDSYIGAAAGINMGIVLYLTLVWFFRSEWTRFASMIGLGGALGSLLGLLIASQDARLWHGRTFREIAVVSAIGALIGAIVSALNRRGQRGEPPGP